MNLSIHMVHLEKFQCSGSVIIFTDPDPDPSINGQNSQCLWRMMLKGQCHEIFCFWFFSSISFPPAPEYPIRTVSIFFENSRRYSQVKVHQRYQRHRWQICHRCQRHRRQNCRRYQRHRRQILTPVSLVLLRPVANLPPVSMTPVANNGNNIRLLRP